MKNIFVLLLLTFCTLVGCGHRQSFDTFKWPPVDSSFDSIVQIMDHARLEMRLVSNSQMDSLRKILETSEHRDELCGRMMFHEGDYVYSSLHNVDSALEIFRTALAITDSSLCPYDYSRIKMALTADPSMSMFEKYRVTKEAEKVFKEYDDSAMMAICKVELGNIFEAIGYTREAVDYYQSAAQIYSEIGADYVIPRIRMNLSVTLFNAGRKHDSDSLIRMVNCDSLVMDNLALRHLALMNYYYITGDSLSLRESYSISSCFPFLLDMKVTEGIELGNMFLNRGEVDSASVYLRDAFSFYNQLFDYKLKRDLLDAIIRLEITKGNLKEIPTLYSHMVHLNDTIESQCTDTKIMAEETRYKIEMLRHEETVKAAGQRLFTWIVSFVGLILLLSVIIIFLSVRTKLLREKMETEHCLLKTRESLTAMKLRNKNTDDILRTAITEVEKLNNDSGETGKTIQWLRNQAALYTAKNKEWDTVLEAVQSIHPYFESRIKKAYPSLTTKQIEFAGFIALGMTTRQIAEVLNIDIASVNTNRYRLRAKMELPKGSSLEEAILKFLRLP